MGNLRFLFVALLLTQNVFSEETGSSEEDSSDYEKSTEWSDCFGGALSSRELDYALDMAAAVDNTGKRCYKAISRSQVRSLFTKSDLDEAFANVSAEVCPSWTESKECLRHHLSSKCDSVETQSVKASNGFNSHLVASELVCGPREDYSILQMFKDAAVNGGLGDCLGNKDRLREISACMDVYTNRDTNIVLPFKEFIPLIFDCGEKTTKVCANGNMEQELAFISLWNKFRKAVQVSYDSLWNHLTAPARFA